MLCVAGDIELGSTLATNQAVQPDAYLNVDMYRMDQVVRNLVTNAVGMNCNSKSYLYFIFTVEEFNS